MTFKEWVERSSTDELVEEIEDSYIHLLICRVLDHSDWTAERTHQYMVDEFRSRVEAEINPELTEEQLDTCAVYEEAAALRERLEAGGGK